MSATPSNMLPLGTIAPDFSLVNVVTTQQQSLTELRSNRATVIIFMCNHCPYVLHILVTLIDVAKKYQAKGIQFIGISSNDVTRYPDDSPEKMRELVAQYKLPFPYLYDETQQVARAYNAACTPDIYVFDDHMACVYRGQFDNSRPGNKQPVTGADLTQALDCILEHKPVPMQQIASIGCNIKWK